MSRLPFARIHPALVRATALLAMAAPADAGLMLDQYADPVARQPHRDKGLEFQNSVVSVWVAGGTQEDDMVGSGVLIGDGTCVLITWHQFREDSVAPVTRPLNRHVWISTGPNYLTDPGESVDVVDFVAHPNAPPPGQLGTDLVVAKLARRPANAKPLEITATPPVVGEILELAGFGIPTIPNSPLIELGELLGGNAPIDSYTDPQTRDYLTTRFRITTPVPFPFGATSYDSGGALARTVTDPDRKMRKELVGTLFGGTTPNSNQFTFSMNLARFRTWIYDQVAVFSTAAPVVPTLACALQPGGQIQLTSGGVPLIQSGGRWLVEEAPDVTGWQPLPVAEQDTLDATRELLRPLGVAEAFFRLRWQPTP